MAAAQRRRVGDKEDFAEPVVGEEAGDGDWQDSEKDGELVWKCSSVRLVLCS